MYFLAIAIFELTSTRLICRNLPFRHNGSPHRNSWKRIIFLQTFRIFQHISGVNKMDKIHTKPLICRFLAHKGSIICTRIRIYITRAKYQCVMSIEDTYIWKASIFKISWYILHNLWLLPFQYTIDQYINQWNRGYMRNGFINWLRSWLAIYTERVKKYANVFTERKTRLLNQ